jgi:DNA-binding GntR family transcriptional regulator
MHQIKKTIAEQVSEILKEKIINLEIKPGTRLDIKSLARQFQISETPIRDALKMLSDNGIVVTTARKGYHVVKLTASDIKEIYELRRLLEGCAIKNGRFDFSRARRLKKGWESLQRETNNEKKKKRFCEMDRRLHSLIIQTSNNRRLREIFFQIYDLVIMCFHLAQEIDKHIEEHIRLLDAILEQDYEKAGKILENHLYNSENDIITELKKRGKKKK